MGDSILAQSSAYADGPPAKRRRRDSTVQDEELDECLQASYLPLDIAQKEIRVLELQLAKALEDDPECVLRTVPLSEARFAAISYLWGDPSSTKPILVNGRPSSVGENAHTVLRYVRDLKTVHHIWIDALCINQKNDSERNQQVALMGEIYTRAEPVLLWTGEDTNDTKTFRRVLRHLKKIRDSSTSRLDFNSPRQWYSLASVLNNTFWRRIWIQQEVIMSSARGQAFLLFGHRCMKYNDFMKGTRALADAAMFLLLDQEDAAALQFLKAYKGLHRQFMMKEDYENARLDPADALDLNSTMEASKPKDRVYGLLGLVPALKLRPDYSSKTSLEEVYQETTAQIFRLTGSLNALVRSSHTDAGSGSLASWSFDWRSTSGTSSILIDDFQCQLYNACAGSVLTALRFDARLIVRSLQLFRIDSMYTFDHGTNGVNFFMRLPGACRWASERMSVQGGRCSKSFEEQFKRTLLMDRFLSSYKKQMRLGSTKRLEALQVSPPVTYFSQFVDQIQEDRISPTDEEMGLMQRFVQHFCPDLHGVSIAVGPGGHLCLLSTGATAADFVHIVAGCNVPLVLRQVGTDSSPKFRLIGPAYVHGVMDGEAVVDSSKRVSTGDPDAYDTAFEDTILV